MSVTMDVTGRLEKLRGKLSRLDVPALLITRSENVSYCTGTEGLRDFEDPHVVLITGDSALLFTDSRYIEAAQAAAAEGLWMVEEPQGVSTRAAVIAAVKDAGFNVVALEDATPYALYKVWENELSEAGISTQPAHNVVEKFRRFKDAGEIERIAAAQAITDAAFAEMLGYMKAGMTEREVAAELEYRMRKLGATGLAFETIIASGSNGPKPHAVPSDRRIESGDLVVMDFGAEKNGYCSDMTRTIAFGEPSAEAREVYEVVLAAQLAALNVIDVDVAGVEVDAAARDYIATAGYGDYFRHGLSHGVGREVHEAPHCTPTTSDVLAVGDVISCEPGIYLPGRFGVRIEDLVVVTEDGCRNFTTSPKELIVL